MTEKLTTTQVIRAIRQGPSAPLELTLGNVDQANRTAPDKLDLALVQLNYQMLSRHYSSAGKDIINRFENFVSPWRQALDSETAAYFLSNLDAYKVANSAGYHHLDWEVPGPAENIVEALQAKMPAEELATSLPWTILMGQIQSTYSRSAASESFSKARNHAQNHLIASFYWDVGALTYFSEAEVLRDRSELPSLHELQTWVSKPDTGSDISILIGMDPVFFRIYAPMILLYAQQAPELDFNILLFTSREEAISLQSRADQYFEGLRAINGQKAPENVIYRAVPTPRWIGNSKTFYASARFLALPDLLQDYRLVYAMDADLFMTRDPVNFLSAQSDAQVSAPKMTRLVGVPPWRRYMAGNFLIGKGATRSEFLDRLLDYLSVGLLHRDSWMLDQNAIAYATEANSLSPFRPLGSDRPNQTGTFMKRWERNFLKASPKSPMPGGEQL